MPDFPPVSRVTALLIVAALALVAWAILGASAYDLRLLTVAGIYALAAIGWQVIFGCGGALSLAHGAFFGLGAYATALLAIHAGVDTVVTLPAAIGVAMALAALVALPVLRLTSHYFALATLGISQVVLLAAIHYQEITGGANGLAGIPGVRLAGWDVPRGLALTGVVWALVALGGFLASRLERGRFGLALEAMAAQPLVARCLGLDPGRLRLAAFLLSAGYAGAAGALSVHTQRVVSPEVLEFPVMVAVLTMVLVGGRQRVSGAILGALLLTHIPEWFRFLERGYLLFYGVALLLVVLLAPEGLTGLLARLAPERSPPPAPPQPLPSLLSPLPQPPALILHDLSKRFGGVIALDQVACVLDRGGITGLIGPNGSGKTTLLNVLSGLEPADSGTVRFDGRNMTRARPEQWAAVGMARTFQAGWLPEEQTVLRAVAAARLSCDPDRRQAEAHAWAALRFTGAETVAGQVCASLPPAARRRVELARAVAREPRLLLLDEPAAGLAEAEQQALAIMLRDLAGRGLAVVVVEHAMSFLLPLADRILCLDNGRLIADDRPERVAATPAVIAAYLGPLAPCSFGRASGEGRKV